MPDARLQRTREAYPELRELTIEDFWDRIPRMPLAPVRIWTDPTTGITHQERLPQRFVPFAEPSDDDLWGV